MQAEPRTDAPDALFVSLYADLVRLAKREVRRSGAGTWLQPSEVVHEAWLDMHARPRLCFDAPAQFLGYAARTMRGLVINQLRALHAKKRGGGMDFADLDETIDLPMAIDQHDTRLVADAIEALEQLDPELSQLVELRFFCGFTINEIARMQGTSVRTTQRKWERAREVLQAGVRS